MIQPRFFLVLVCIVPSCIGSFIVPRVEAQSTGRTKLLIDEPDGPRPAAGLDKGGVPLCKSVGTTAAPYLRSPPPGEKRPRFSKAVPNARSMSIRLGSEYLHDRTTVGAAKADLAAFGEALRKNEYEDVLRYLGTVDRILAGDTTQKRFPLSTRRYAYYIAEMGQIHAYLGYFNEAAKLHCVAINLYASTPQHDHKDVARVLYALALVLIGQGRDAEAEDILQRFRRTVDEMPGIDHSDYALREDAYLGLLDLYAKQGRFKEAEEVLVKANAAAKKAFSYHDLALHRAFKIFVERGRYGEAEKVAKDLVLSKKAPTTHLAWVYFSQGRIDDALELYQSMWKLVEKDPRYIEFKSCSVGPDLAHLLIRKEQLALAQQVISDTLKGVRSLYQMQSCLPQALATDGLVQLTVRQLSQAEARFKEALDVAKDLGDELVTATRLQDLAYFYRQTQKYEVAQALADQSLKLRLPRLGAGHPYVVGNLADLALIAAQQGQWRPAYDHAKAAIGMMGAFEHTEYVRGVETWSVDEGRTNAKLLSVFIRAGIRLGLTDAGVGEELFLAAQRLATTKVAKTVLKAAARSIGLGASADLFRKREDLVARLEATWKRLRVDTIETPGLDRETRSQIIRNLEGLVDEYGRMLRAIDKQLGSKIVDYAAFSGLTALGVGEVAPLLRADQILLQFVELPALETLPAEVAVVALTTDSRKIFRADLGGTSLKDFVAILRCGLDREGEWEREGDVGPWKGKNRICQALQPQGIPHGRSLPFALGKAHKLFEALLGPIKGEIKNKHLLLVATGALATLPLHVLVTEPPRVPVGRSAADFRGVAWLAQSNAATVVPSVASLKALAEKGRAEQLTIPYMGFGNPFLNGDGSSREIAKAKKARTLNSCADVDPLHDGGDHVSRALRTTISEILHAGKNLARIESIRVQSPLWETAIELCEVAKSLRASTHHVYLGAYATETNIADLDRTGKLSRARILHFATHAFLATDWDPEKVHDENLREAGLLLTPPSHGTPEDKLAKDDGLLTLSEIAYLKLNADWVILSACNTAGGERTGGEALSGLARAFFFAGARALLASHWYVDSTATTELLTHVFQAFALHPRITKAEALRKSMQKMLEQKTIDGSSSPRSHPSYWAPFVVVGAVND